MNTFDLLINAVESFTICYFLGKYFELKKNKQYILSNITIFLEIVVGNIFINNDWVLITIVGLTLLLLLRIWHVKIKIESIIFCVCILFMDIICNNVASLAISFFHRIISHESISLIIGAILSKLLFIFVVLYMSNKKIKFNTQLDENRYISIEIVLFLLLVSFYILEKDYTTDNIYKLDIFVCMILMLVNVIIVINIYLKILEEETKIKYKKENYIVLSRMSDELYRLQHNLRYVLLKIKYSLNDKEYDKCLNLIDNYVDKLRKFQLIINTDNPYFDYFMNQKINDLSNNEIDVHTSINISHSDYYLDREYVEYLIKIINLFKLEATQITINIYEKQEFNIIEVLTSKNMKLTFDNSLKQLAQHLDAQYKNTQDDNICIFKSIQSMK